MMTTMKNTLATMLLTGAVAVSGLTACSSSDDSIAEEPTPVVTPTQPQTYRVSIPASMGDGDGTTRAVSFDNTTETPTSTSTFAEGDKVYVYNETKGAMACDGEGNVIALTLTPGDLSNGGKNCTLRGNLTFYKYENSTWNAVTVDDSDTYKLLYNLSYPDTEDPTNSYFEYYEQNGTAAGIADYAIATTTLTNDGGVLKPASTATFQNVQSIFRFKFIDESSTPINVKHLVITSKKSAIAPYYIPIGVNYICSSIPVTLTTPTTDYIYVALCIKESEAAGDELMFTAVDADGKVYTGTKATPASGFENRKYYYNTSAITLTHDASRDITKPTIVWTNPSTPVELNYQGQYNLYTSNFDITLNGTSRNCSFSCLNAGTVRLNGIDATDYVQFFYSGANLTVELLNGSANTIVNTNGTNCIGANTLKLSGNGTLTVTAKSADDCGIRGTNNYGSSSNNDNATTTEIDVSAQLAAPGYKVIRSARTNNGNGTYTWTYTVYPVGAINGKFTVNNSGKQVYISQGNLQATYDGSAWSWAFATNQWDYIGNAVANTKVKGSSPWIDGTGTVDLFGWSTDHPINYFGIINSGNHTGNFIDWGSLAITNGGNATNAGWRTLTKDEWDYLLSQRLSGSTVNGQNYARYTKATVNGVKGLIIFPDNVTIANSEASWGTNTINHASSDYANTTCTADQWTALEAKGCVFLPAAGYRNGTNVLNAGDWGIYWSSTSADNSKAYCMSFTSGLLNYYNSYSRDYGCSVRLVRDAQ